MRNGLYTIEEVAEIFGESPVASIWEGRGIEKGIEKGRAEGRHETALATARKLKGMGLSAKQIAEATGLDAETIEKL